MKILQILLLVGAYLILNSCCTNEEIYLSIDETYLPLYNEGDTLVFTDNKGIFDTLFVVNVKKFEEKVPYKDFCGTTEHRESIRYTIDSISSYQQNTSNNIFINYNTRINISLFGSFYTTNNLEQYSILDKLEINGIIYTNIYHFSDESNNELSIFYDIKQGILRYSDKNNTWDLLMKN